MSVDNFTLDRGLFNNDLYSRLNSFWFKDVPDNATAAPRLAVKKWYGMGTDEEKAAFDAECAMHAGEALQSIGPEKLTLPAFESHEVEEKHAQAFSRPLLDEVKQAQEKDEKEGSDVLLALMVLLDQMPRNIFRTQDTLPRVYNHYDRLALALLRSSMRLTPNPVDCPAYFCRPVVQMWFLMPLMHSEAMSAHEEWYRLTKGMETRMKEKGDDEAVEAMKGSFNAAASHDEPLKRFGRYPHRNQCLGRQNTAEEERFLETADTFGVKQNPKSKDEL